MADIAVESFDVDVGASGSTHTLTTDVGSTSSAFVKINNSTDKSSSGPTGSTSNTNPNVAHVATRLTDTDELTFTRNSSTTVKVVGEVWRYTGSASGANEFINRGTYAISVNSGSSSGSTAVSGISDEDACVPFLVGVDTNENSRSEYDKVTFAVYMDGSGNVVAERNNTGASGHTTTVYVNVVEFTGSNWNVGHGVSSNHDTANETITLNTDSTGTGGSTFDVGDWETAFIEATGGGDSVETGLADIMFTVYPAGTTTQAVVSYHEGDGNARNDSSAYVHVIQNDDLIVKRANSTNVSEGNGSYGTVSWPTGASTSRNLDELALEWFCDTSGTGTAHKRGSLGTRITDATGTITHWVHRSGNTVDARYAVIDLSQLEDAGGGTTTVTGDEGVITPIADSGSTTATSSIDGNEGAIVAIADSAEVVSTSIVIGDEGVITSVADTGSVQQTTDLTADEGVITPVADNGSVVQLSGETNITGDTTKGFYVDEVGDPHLEIVYNNWFIDQDGKKVTPIAGNIWSVEDDVRYMLTITPHVHPKAILRGIADVGTVVATSVIAGNEGVITGHADEATLDVAISLVGAEGVITPIADNGTVVQTTEIASNEGTITGIAGTGTVVATTQLSGAEGVIEAYSDQATIVAEGTVVGTEGVIISKADNGSVTATTSVVGTEGVIIATADSGSIGAPATDITPDEGTILAYADNGTVTQTSVIVGTEGVIIGIADNATLIATGTIIANEGTIIAVADNGTVTQTTELVPSEGVIVGIADNGAVSQVTALTPAEGVMTPIADSGTVTVSGFAVRVTDTGNTRITSSGNIRITKE